MCSKTSQNIYLYTNFELTTFLLQMENVVIPQIGMKRSLESDGDGQFQIYNLVSSFIYHITPIFMSFIHKQYIQLIFGVDHFLFFMFCPLTSAYKRDPP